MKHTILAVSLAAILAACGGGSDSPASTVNALIGRKRRNWNPSLRRSKRRVRKMNRAAPMMKPRSRPKKSSRK